MDSCETSDRLHQKNADEANPVCFKRISL